VLQRSGVTPEAVVKSFGPSRHRQASPGFRVRALSMDCRLVQCFQAPSLTREWLSTLAVSRCICGLYVFTRVLVPLCVTAHAAPLLVRAVYYRSCLIVLSFCYNGISVTFKDR